MKKSKHNGNISIWKFIFAICILIHHTSVLRNASSDVLFQSLSIGVEFFFIVSGYLLAKKVYSEKDDDRPLYKATFDFIKNKIKGFYPYLLFSFVILLLISLVFHEITLDNFIFYLSNLTLIQLIGLKTSTLIGGVWYLSALVLSMTIIYPLMKKYKKNFSCLIAPLISLFMGGYLIHNVVSIRNYSVWNHFMYVGLQRAIVEVCLGVVAYEITDKLKKVNFTKLGSLFLSITQLSCFTLVILANAFFKTRRYDWLFILMVFIGIVIGFSERTAFLESCNNKIFYYLEKLSLPIYKELSYAVSVILVILLTILISMFELVFVKFISRKMVKPVKKVKGLLIEN